MLILVCELTTPLNKDIARIVLFYKKSKTNVMSIKWNFQNEILEIFYYVIKHTFALL